MIAQDGYSMARPLFFDGVYFVYYRSRMVYYLMMDTETWFMLKDGFKVLVEYEDEFETSKLILEQKYKGTHKDNDYTTVWIDNESIQQSQPLQEH